MSPRGRPTVGSAAESLLGGLVAINNRSVRRHETGATNPRSLDGLRWHSLLVERAPVIRAEWDRFTSAGSRLPLIEQLIAESQGNEGPWRAGLLWSRGRPAGPLVTRFPATIASLAEVPGLRSALWSVLEPGTELPEHCGPNAGVLRYHLGVDCTGDTCLRVGPVVVPYENGVGILFDDTAPHAAWNRSRVSRVTLFCEVLRPLPVPAALFNRATQSVLSLDPRYRRASQRATEWEAALSAGR